MVSRCTQWMNSCQVPISTISPGPRRQNFVDKMPYLEGTFCHFCTTRTHQVGFQPTTLWLRVEIMTVFAREQKCPNWIIIQTTVFWTVCMQNYIAMRNLKCAIKWWSGPSFENAVWITHRDVILRTHGPKCCIWMIIQIAQFKLPIAM